METAEAWRTLFENWPEAIPKQGLIITTFQEAIPFVNFLVSGGVLLIDRDKPDAVGGRKIMIAYTAISAVKITSPIELARFNVMGFQAPFG